jgi:hypothetical protein
METQTFTLLLCLAALAAAGSLLRVLAQFLYSGLLSPGPSWAALRVYQAPWSAIRMHLRLGAFFAVRSADVDLSVLDAHADPAVLRMSGLQVSVTL